MHIESTGLFTCSLTKQVFKKKTLAEKIKEKEQPAVINMSNVRSKPSSWYCPLKACVSPLASQVSRLAEGPPLPSVYRGGKKQSLGTHHLTPGLTGIDLGLAHHSATSLAWSSLSPVAFPRPLGLEPMPPHADSVWESQNPKDRPLHSEEHGTALPAGWFDSGQSHKWCWSTKGRRLPVESSGSPALPQSSASSQPSSAMFTSSPRQDTESPTVSPSK